MNRILSLTSLTLAIATSLMGADTTLSVQQAATNFALSSEPGKTPSASGYSTENARILDSFGNPIRIHGTALYGNALKTNIILAFQQQGWQQTLRDMVSMGFNALRISAFETGMLKDWPMDQNLGPNTDLKGLSSLQVYDKVIDYCNQIGLLVFFDCHSTVGDISTGFTSNGKGGWVGDGCDTATLVLAFQAMATRYRGKIFCYELMNEPWSSVAWNRGGENNAGYRGVYQTVGSAILAIDPSGLIGCSGALGSGKISDGFTIDGSGGGDLSIVDIAPVVFTVGGRQITNKSYYVAHEYPYPWNANDGGTPGQIDRWFHSWGRLMVQNKAAVCITECGTDGSTPAFLGYIQQFVPYINGTFGGAEAPTIPVGFLWWTWCVHGRPGGNPDSGILDENYGFINPRLRSSCAAYINTCNAVGPR